MGKPTVVSIRATGLPMATAVPGTTTEPCANCGHETLVAPSTRKKFGDEFHLLCRQCFEKRGLMENDVLHPLTVEQAVEGLCMEALRQQALRKQAEAN